MPLAGKFPPGRKPGSFGLGALAAASGGGVSPLLDANFTGGYLPGGFTFTRASGGLDYSVQPAVLMGNNVPRLFNSPTIDRLNGILIEGADTSPVIRNYYGPYLAGDWAKVNITDTEDATVDLYDGGSIKLVENAGVGGQWTQTVLLTAVNWVTSALVYTDGSAVTNADMEMVMGQAPAVTARATTFEHVGNGVYLAWCVQLATAANWNVGIEVKANKTVYCTCLSSYIANPANSYGGDYPRSPIPNSGAGAVTRAADSLGIAGVGNVGTTEGTVDVEAVAPCAETEVHGAADAAQQMVVAYYENATNRFWIALYAIADSYQFSLNMGGAAACTNSAATGCARNDTIKSRMIYRQPATLDGVNYGILYTDIGAGWIQLTQNNTQPTGTLTTGGTIYVGRYGGLAGYAWNYVIRRVRTYDRAIYGVPTW